LSALQTESGALDRIFQALADPSRRGMIDRLRKGPASVKEIAEPFAFALPSVLKHLRVLEASGIVHSEKSGRVRTYRIEVAALEQVEQWVAARKAVWSDGFDRLEDFLSNTTQRRKRGKR
jgi:DNA-binding transcriptional ArsR family regulator